MMRHDEEQAPWRRFLDDLQQRVGAVEVEVLRAVDDADAPAALPGRGPEEADCLAGELAGMTVGMVFFSAFHCRRSTKRLVCDCAPRCARAAGASAGTARLCACCTSASAWIGMGEHEARRAVGEGRLADPFRPAQDPGVGKAPALVGVQEGGLGCILAEERRRLAGMRRRRRAGRLPACRRSAAISAALPPRRRARITTAQIASATAPSLPLASIDAQRSGSAAAIARKACRSASWKSSASRSKRSTSAASRAAPPPAPVPASAAGPE